MEKIHSLVTYLEWWIRACEKREQWWAESEEATKDHPKMLKKLLNSKAALLAEDASSDAPESDPGR